MWTRPWGCWSCCPGPRATPCRPPRGCQGPALPGGRQMSSPPVRHNTTTTTTRYSDLRVFRASAGQAGQLRGRGLQLLRAQLGLRAFRAAAGDAGGGTSPKWSYSSRTRTWSASPQAPPRSSSRSSSSSASSRSPWPAWWAQSSSWPTSRSYPSTGSSPNPASESGQSPLSGDCAVLSSAECLYCYCVVNIGLKVSSKMLWWGRVSEWGGGGGRLHWRPALETLAVLSCVANGEKTLYFFIDRDKIESYTNKNKFFITLY